MKFLEIGALNSGVTRTAALAAASQLAMLENVPTWSGVLPPESNRTSQNSISPQVVRTNQLLTLCTLKAETDRRRSQWRASGFAFQLSWCHPRAKGRIGASSSSPFQPAIAAWFCNCLAGNLQRFFLAAFKTA